MEVKIPALKGNNDTPTNQTTDVMGHREITLDNIQASRGPNTSWAGFKNRFQNRF